MKHTKKVLSVVFAVLMAVTMFNIFALAADESVTARFLNYNVAGQPNVDYLLGRGGFDVSAKQKYLGEVLNESDFDVVATQEDFSFHKNLISGMTSYQYKTKSSGGVVGGDGLNIMTKNQPIYNCTRITWDVCFGSIAEGDTLAPKGMMFTVLDMGNGIFVDFYDLHADAFDGDGSALAREAQYKQLMAYIEKNSADRPVIITGDFNTSLHIQNTGDNGADEAAMYDVIYTEHGFKDAWIELVNEGDYQNFSKWYATGQSYWGHWDSVEKFYYRDGKDITVEPSDFTYIDFRTADNSMSISDHNAAACTFTFTKTADFVEDARPHTVNTKSDFAVFVNLVKWIFKDLMQVFTHFDEVKAFLGI